MKANKRVTNKKWKRGLICGSFDVIHPGYIHLFRDAKSVCGKLIIALQSDPTVDRPEKSYVEDEAYDMEAAGFFKAASNFSETELISSIKVISDNKTSSIDNITEKLIENLMLKTIAHVEPVVSVLKKRLAILNKGLVLDRDCLDMVKSIHLTVSQRNQFKSLCRRFDALGKEDELKFILNCSRITSDQLLKKLTEKLAKQAH